MTELEPADSPDLSPLSAASCGYDPATGMESPVRAGASDSLEDRNPPWDETLPAPARFYLGLMRRRYACKRFVPGRRIPPELRYYILECGRLSPSSFGLEPWKFSAVECPRPDSPWLAAFFGQEAAVTASLLVVISVLREACYDPDSAFVRSRSARFPGGHPVFRADYEGYYRFLRDEGRLIHWARAQTYIAATSMMTGAMAADVDSLALEGYDEGEVLGVLDLDPKAWAVGLCVAFGYRDEAVRGKIREPLASIAEVRDTCIPGMASGRVIPRSSA